MAATRNVSATGRKTSPKKTRRNVQNGSGLAVEIEHLGDDLRRRAEAAFKDIDAREKRLEKEGLRLARALVHKFRIGLHESMDELGKRVAELEKRAARLERRLT